jgi:hypothetical protein
MGTDRDREGIGTWTGTWTWTRTGQGRDRDMDMDMDTDRDGDMDGDMDGDIDRDGHGRGQQRTPGGKKIYNFNLLQCQKYAENCGSEALKLRTSEKIAHFRKNCDCRIAELLLRSAFL